MQTYLSKRGYVLKKEDLTDVELESLKKELRGIPLQDDKYQSNGSSSFPLYIETKNKVYIPKMYGIKKYGAPSKELENYKGKLWEREVPFQGKLYPVQNEAVSKLMFELTEGSSGGILSLGTGAGKTISSIYAMSQLKTKSLVIVNKISLLKQWETEIAQFMPDARIGIIQGKNVEIQDKEIVIAMLQSLAKIEYPQEIFDNFGVVVFDEIHNVCCRVFSKVLMKVCSKYTIGLSATPKRSDGCEYVFRWFIGDIVYKSTTERSGLPPIINTINISSVDYKEIVTTNKASGQKQLQFTSMLSDLVKMPKRNKLILEIVKDLVNNEQRRVLVLSDRREHLKELLSLLDMEVVSFTYGLFVGGMKIKDLEKNKSCQVVLATFQAFGEGVSEKGLDTLVLTTPKKFIGHLDTVKKESGKLEQIIGRIFRKEHIDKPPMIVDLQDNFSVYKNQSNQRLTFYKTHFKKLAFKEQMFNMDAHNVNAITISALTVKQNKLTKKSELLYETCMFD